MKHRITLSIALALGIALVSLTSPVNAQNQLVPVADSGVVTLGPNQVLRVTAASGRNTGGSGNDRVRVSFQQIKYEICSASPKLCVVSENTSNPILLGANEAAVVDAADYVVWRTVVLSNRPDVKVTGIVFDTSTMRVVSSVHMNIDLQ